MKPAASAAGAVLRLPPPRGLPRVPRHHRAAAQAPPAADPPRRRSAVAAGTLRPAAPHAARGLAGTQRRGFAAAAPDQSQQKLYQVLSYFKHKDKWKDPWAMIFQGQVPAPRDLGNAMDWTEPGHYVVDNVEKMLMPQSRFDKAIELRRTIERTLQKAMDEPDLGVHTLGSVMSGLATRTSDLDLCIVRGQTDGVSNDPTSRDEQLEHLEDYMTMLSRPHGFEMQLIGARVPILRRQRGPDDDITIDISLYVHGVRNSVVLREYARRCPYFLPMSLILREWAKHAQVCDSLAGYLTPYCINVMLIKYLAQHDRNNYIPVPPLLPVQAYPREPSRNLLPPHEFATRRTDYVAKLGYHIADFLYYYAVFRWQEKVIAAADPAESDERADSALWAQPSATGSLDAIIEEMFAREDTTLPIPNMSSKVDVMRVLKVREAFMYGYVHLVKNGYLPWTPENRGSGGWEYGTDGPVGAHEERDDKDKDTV
eukprot:TRINITY_DN12968_c0_g1_i2.p1 TRINITY_DN12968_c0_g1~~TRINITY_DN12968_c0_g1_i2.p1  ORF type:complete len:483 (+),score=117.17 TRINITY_DN12968_c0_g1_i2:99-1547(+)